MLQGQLAAPRLPRLLVWEVWEAEARQQWVAPMAAKPQWAASYVQFITEEEDSGSAGRPATAPEDPEQDSPCPRRKGPTKAP